jgi:hypothetical protein
MRVRHLRLSPGKGHRPGREVDEASDRGTEGRASEYIQREMNSHIETREGDERTQGNACEPPTRTEVGPGDQGQTRRDSGMTRGEAEIASLLPTKADSKAFDLRTSAPDDGLGSLGKQPRACATYCQCRGQPGIASHKRQGRQSRNRAERPVLHRNPYGSEGFIGKPVRLTEDPGLGLGDASVSQRRRCYEDRGSESHTRDIARLTAIHPRRIGLDHLPQASRDRRRIAGHLTGSTRSA